MTIYINTPNRIIQYKSNIIPRKDEILFFPHFGSFIVKEVIHHISDDSEDKNKLMWININALEEFE